jgi:hypothetical protein
MGVAVYFVYGIAKDIIGSNLSVIVSIIVGGVIYLAAMLICGGIEKDEVMGLLKESEFKMKKIIIGGMGTSSIEHITLKTHNAILNAEKIFIRTLIHESAKDILELRPDAQSFDEI